ncbi:hypothetical protein BJ973_002937 [Actinoplanes tereljensis]|uniref:Uncharacterized protein n=1 Tax=Paractinoplanes tereljensis TaxID=571912 RepID=A0A919NPD7_9ACTN|nr:hypothetical protein [Actinoplanes tereljensis]GIF22614.1 hypothetical protein Ate02nite_53440 [Actinoplanes tereljensis]
MSEPEPATAKTAAETEKLRWEARGAQLDAERKERENAEWDSEPARRLRAAESLQKQTATLVPDLSTLDKGELTVTGVIPIGAHQALALAASQVATTVGPLLSEPVLLTSDPDLVTASAAAVQMEATLTNLLTAAGRLLPAPPDAAESAVVAALAAAVPSVLGLFTAKRSLTTIPVSVDDLSAVAAIAGELIAAKKTVRHDDFRMVPPDDPLFTRLGVLHDRRRELATKRAPAADALVAEIDQFFASLSTVPPGAKRSLLTTALLWHNGPVLLVKSQGGASTQLVNDRPFLFRDRVSVVTTVAVSFLLTRPPGDTLQAAGTEVGTATLTGTIGTSLTWNL